jgi:hypothetical protein
MKELHAGPSKRHFTTEIMQRKILDAGYWWPTIYIGTIYEMGT